MNALLNELDGIDLPDHTKTPTIERSTPEAGPTTARFVGYIELGKRKQADYQGEKRAPADSVLLVFELNGKAHLRETDSGIMPNLKYETMTVKLGDKGGFKKLFNKMKAGRDSITHMAKMLGEGFILRIHHNKGTGDKKDVVYANIKNSEGEWSVAPPFAESPIDGTVTHFNVPQAITPVRLLLWDRPSKGQWDSLFIDGSRKRKNKEGVEEEVSNNWIQESIVRQATNFEGSALEAMLLAAGGVNFDTTSESDIDDNGDVIETADSAPEKPAETPASTPKPDAVAAKPADPAVQPAKTEAPPTASAEDLMKALGL